MNMKCPVCGAAELVRDTRDMPHAYKGETIIIPAVTGDFCPGCGEVLLDMAESERCVLLMREFSSQVNAAFVQREFSARGLASNDDTSQSGEYFSNEDVLCELDDSGTKASE